MANVILATEEVEKLDLDTALAAWAAADRRRAEEVEAFNDIIARATEERDGIEAPYLEVLAQLKDHILSLMEGHVGEGGKSTMAHNGAKATYYRPSVRTSWNGKMLQGLALKYEFLDGCKNEKEMPHRIVIRAM